MSITIHLSFWLVSLLFGFAFTGSVALAPVFAFVAFVSILVHELGHALMARSYGLRPRVELYALGGVTTVSMKGISLFKEFAFVLMGPVFGGCLAGLFGAISIYWENPPHLAGVLIYLFYNLNVLWTLLNLLPVHPLDGGRLMSIFCEWAGGKSGLRFSYLLSCLFAGLLAFLFFAYAQGLEIMGALLLLFAFDSLRAYRESRGKLPDAEEEKIENVLSLAEKEWRQGNIAGAIQTLQGLLQNVPKTSHAFLDISVAIARCYMTNKEPEKVFQTLFPIQKSLQPDELALLQKAAFDSGKFEETLQVGEKLFVETNSKEVAELNAEAATKLGRKELAANWAKSVSLE